MKIEEAERIVNVVIDASQVMSLGIRKPRALLKWYSNAQIMGAFKIWIAERFITGYRQLELKSFKKAVEACAQLYDMVALSSEKQREEPFYVNNENIEKFVEYCGILGRQDPLYWEKIYARVGLRPKAFSHDHEGRDYRWDGKTLEIGLPAGQTMRFCWCPPGRFHTLNETGATTGLRKLVSVALTKGFWMAETEVTQVQWQSVMGTNPSHFKGASLPVEQVSWEDAQEMVRRLNQRALPPAGFRFALPTEAQWEYACRAGDQKRDSGGRDRDVVEYALGKRISRNEANVESSETVPVKSYPPNHWGLYDMHGNVSEWCEDRYDGNEEYEGGVDREGPSDGFGRIHRGGSWFSEAMESRAAFRSVDSEEIRSDCIGLRVALVPQDREMVAGKTLELSWRGTPGIRFCFCPPGVFTMGSPLTEPERRNNENQVGVTISDGFWMAETVVTQELWESFMGSNPSRFEGCRNPVESVSWEEVQAMVRAVSQEVCPPFGYKVALPTEAQWEYACRAGTETAYAFGNELTPKQANFGSEQTVAVKSYRPNQWGLYDMHGNVWEWCEDGYCESPQGGMDPKATLWSEEKVLRGGSWNGHTGSCRTAFRFGIHQSIQGSNIGFRLALVPHYLEPEPGEKVDVSLPGGEVLRFCYCPAGRFTMGGEGVEHSGHLGNAKQVAVTISRGFWMAETAVTDNQWNAVMGAPPNKRENCRTCYTWHDAQEMVARLNSVVQRRLDFRFALPTEAQWEHAFRAGIQHMKWEQVREIWGTIGKDGVLKGRHGPNRWGLYDMAGVGPEWCADWLGDGLDGGDDPKGPDTGVCRVVRGRAFYIPSAAMARAPFRYGLEPERESCGIRLALIN